MKKNINYSLGRSRKAKISNCPVCKRAYVNDGKGMCLDCYAKEEIMRLDVCVYVREHPKCTAGEVIMETGAKPSLVRKMMKEGALQIDDVSDLKYPCARCGTPITEGKYCTQCLEAFGNEIAKAKKQIIAKRREERKKREENEKQGMYIIESLME